MLDPGRGEAKHETFCVERPCCQRFWREETMGKGNPRLAQGSFAPWFPSPAPVRRLPWLMGHSGAARAVGPPT